MNVPALPKDVFWPLTSGAGTQGFGAVAGAVALPEGATDVMFSGRTDRTAPSDWIRTAHRPLAVGADPTTVPLTPTSSYSIVEG